MKCYIFDIDGTLADCSHRLHHIQKQPKDWDAFFAETHKDAPIEHMLDLLRLIIAADCLTIFVSGRPERTRYETIWWLESWADLCVPPRLYMRADGDRRDDDIIKIELLAQIRADGYEPIMAFDDRTRVVNAWRAAGIPCAQVAPGDF